MEFGVWGLGFGAQTLLGPSTTRTHALYSALSAESPRHGAADQPVQADKTLNPKLLNPKTLNPKSCAVDTVWQPNLTSSIRDLSRFRVLGLRFTV